MYAEHICANTYADVPATHKRVDRDLPHGDVYTCNTFYMYFAIWVRFTTFYSTQITVILGHWQIIYYPYFRFSMLVK